MNHIQTIREALEPFAKDAAGIHPDWADERRRTSLTGADKITVGDVRRAEKALAALAELEKQHQEPVAWCPALTYPGHEKDRAWANGKPRKEDIEYWALNGKGITYAYAAPVAQQPQARTDFTDEWTGYLKDGETPFERFLRERKDLDALTKLYQRALEDNERLKAQQPQAEAVPTIYASRGQLENLKPDPEDEAGTYLPVRKTPKGKFTHPLFAAPQQAEAVPNEVERVLKRLDSSDPDFDDCAAAAALIIRMAHEMKGPDGFATWKEAAMAERMRRLKTAPRQAEAVPHTTFDGVIPSAIRGYLRRCSSGGMSKKHIDIVQANVDEAERLGYFKLAIAEAILASRAAAPKGQP